jgi:hypothetical protein
MTREKAPVSPSKSRGRCQIDDREHAQTRRTTRSVTKHCASVSPPGSMSQLHVSVITFLQTGVRRKSGITSAP